jgi:major membrane immunogen (membrane-anchored lipoprotein)
MRLPGPSGFGRCGPFLFLASTTACHGEVTRALGACGESDLETALIFNIGSYRLCRGDDSSLVDPCQLPGHQAQLPGAVSKRWATTLEECQSSTSVDSISGRAWKSQMLIAPQS